MGPLNECRKNVARSSDKARKRRSGCGLPQLRAQHRSAPKGRQQMGETGFCKNLRFYAVSCENLRLPAVSCANLRFPAASCENLRFPAVFCADLRLPNPLIYRASRKSAKTCQNLRKCVRSGSGLSLLQHVTRGWLACDTHSLSLSCRCSVMRGISVDAFVWHIPLETNLLLS